MSYTRSGVMTGGEIVLTTVFVDQAGEFLEPDALPQLYIYDASVETDTIDAEIAAETFASALAGPLAPTLAATGMYRYIYTVPAGDQEEGTWHDVWRAEEGGIPFTNYLSFTVVEGVEVTYQNFPTNQLITVELDSSVADITGDLTLGQDIVFGFSTIYNPLYASPTLLRVEYGAWLDVVPDDTLALLIHLSSLEAKRIATGKKCVGFKHAAERFVIFDVGLKLMMLPGGFGGDVGGSTTGGSKQLGNLRIIRGSGSSMGSNSAGIDPDTLKWMREQRDQWWRVVNGGGCLMPGESYAPLAALRGVRHPTGRRNSGRLWKYCPGDIPPANGKLRNSLYELARFQNVGQGWGYDPSDVDND